MKMPKRLGDRREYFPEELFGDGSVYLSMLIDELTQ